MSSVARLPAQMLTPESLPASFIAQKLRSYPPQPGTIYPDGMLEGQPRPAAVLLPLLVHEGGWRLLFIRRAFHPEDLHSGQVAFPGGGWEPGDRSPVEAALREAREEVGVDPAGVQVLGTMQEGVTISNYRVTPVVGVVAWPFEVTTDPAEVTRVFTIPLGWLADPANHEVRYRTIPPFASFPVIYFQPYEGEVLWGFSARVTLHLLEVLELKEAGELPL